jgi:hypothetical protein
MPFCPVPQPGLCVPLNYLGVCYWVLLTTLYMGTVYAYSSTSIYLVRYLPFTVPLYVSMPGEPCLLSAGGFCLEYVLCMTVKAG